MGQINVGFKLFMQNLYWLYMKLLQIIVISKLLNHDILLILYFLSDLKLVKWSYERQVKHSQFNNIKTSLYLI